MINIVQTYIYTFINNVFNSSVFMSDQKKQRVIILPNHTKLTGEAIRKFDNLLEFVTPDELRRDITEIYHQYIIKEHKMLPIEFEKTATNLYVLIDFLNDMEKTLNSKSN